MHRLAPAVFFILTGLSFGPKAAEAATLVPGEVLEIRFSVTAAVCPSGICDTLLVYWNEAGSYNSANTVTELFDGTTLLGSASNSVCCFSDFRSSASLFLDGNTTIDFTTINSGTINGIVDLSIGTGYLTWPADPTSYLLLGHADGPGLVLGGTGLDISSVSILSPEPSATILIATGVAFLVYRSRLRAA